MKSKVAAIVLAAGQSSRMGAFKPLLPFGRQTVIEQCINSLGNAGIKDIVVVVGHRADEVKERLKDVGVSFALNPDPDSAMGVSIACGLEHISNEAGAVLIALADHPAVSSETITEILQEWKKGHRIVQPEHDGRGGHPVVIDLNFREELLNLDVDNGLRGFFEKHRKSVRRLTVDSPYVARDMDTWEDYVRLYEDVFGSSPD
jgi:CTP:molybdopterin cytidylyltransferase MocA